MNCNDVEKMIIAGEVDDTAREHLAYCTPCQEFSGFYRMLMHSAPKEAAETLPELDTILRREAEKKRNKFKIIAASFTSGAAACIAAIVLTVLVQYWYSVEKQEKQSNISDSNMLANWKGDFDLSPEPALTMSWDNSLDDNIQYLLADAVSPWQIEVYNPFIMEQ